MRGEHPLLGAGVDVVQGSSPHARGAQGRRGRARVQPGIIPACAGSTCTPTADATGYKDHPRMRGEHEWEGRTGMQLEGSSPHARGALTLPVVASFSSGIIPACAGSTAARPLGMKTLKDHPRMRGEHKFAWIKSRRLEGSSPHARGAHFTTSASGQHSRLIHSLFASSSHPSGLSSDYIFARRDTCWHCSNPWKAHRQVSRHQCRSVGE